MEEALANAQEAISGHIAALDQIGAPVPVEGAALPADAVRAITHARTPERVVLSRVAA